MAKRVLTPFLEDAPEPEDVAAQTFGAPMTLAQLIQRFRGEAITLSVGGMQYHGTIYGVENRSTGGQVRETVVLLEDEGLQSIELAHVDQVRFEKEELRTTLRQAMQGVAKTRKANQKTLHLLFDGEGERSVQFAYVVDMSIWRMTYRLSIKEDDVYLQGWAHIDNVTGVDWEKVAVELRSGKPQSFHINIFTPLMAERPDFGNAVYEFTQGMVLVVQQFATAAGLGPDDVGLTRGGFGGGGFGGGGGGIGGRPGPSSFGSGRRASPGVDIESAFREAAQESRTAQMVRYVLDEPVDLGAGRSAALPVFSDEVPAQLISVFDEEDEGTSPFRAVQITNTTGLPVVSGPVSIMREGDFVGDGKLGRLDVEQKAEIIYGVDRPIEIVVRTERNLDSKLASVSLDKKKGIILYHDKIRKTVFEIDNRDVEPRELILYCDPANEDVDETMDPQPESTREGRARYTVTSEARSKQHFTVTYQHMEEETKSLSGANARLLNLDENPEAEISDEARQLLQSLIEIEDQHSSAETESQELSKKKRSLEGEQSRVRENIEVLANNPEAAKPFLDKVQEIETQIEEVNAQIAESQATVERLEKEKTETIDRYFND